MRKRHIPVLLSLLGVAAIAQLLFFWLDPHVQCSMTVYLFTTCLTAVNTVLCFVLWIRRSTGRIPAAVIAGSGMWLAMLIAGGILLGIDAAVRTAVFCLSILAVLYLVCVAPLLGTAAVRSTPVRRTQGCTPVRPTTHSGPPPLP